MQNLYETLLIVAPDADDERVNAVIGDLRTVVETDGGEVLQAGVWERRKLAYHVQGYTEGIYVLMYADGSSSLPAALKQRMKLDESVIRSMVVRLQDQQEADVRQHIADADHTEDAEKIAAQKAAAERRHEAEQAAAAMSLEEQVAAEEFDEEQEAEEKREAGELDADEEVAEFEGEVPAVDVPVGPEADEEEAEASADTASEDTASEDTASEDTASEAAADDDTNEDESAGGDADDEEKPKES
jgi:small subunit ribosomal protein S6